MRLAAAIAVVGALAAALVVSPDAIANGRFPAAQHVLIGPGPTSRVIALRTTFGFIVSDDSGRTFHWICEDALGYPGSPFDPAFALDPMGALHVGLFDGVVRASADRCDYSRNAVLENQYVIDLDQSLDGRVIVAVTSDGSPGVHNKVFRSDDGGGSFRPLGDGIVGVLFETLEMAATDTQRVYLSAVNLMPRRVVIYRSDDGGTTLRELPFDPPHRLNGAFIAGVDPRDRDVVYLRGNLDTNFDAGGAEATSVLLRSRDGGTSWQEIARTAGPMLGFAISDDGRTLWYGGPDPRDGLMRSSDGGDSFTRIGQQEVLCLRQHAGTLYMCANYVLHDALGRSTDRGDTFQSVVRFEDVQGPFTCPETSPENNLCGARWPRVHAMFVAAPEIDSGTVVERDAGMDARGDVEMGSGGACGCRIADSRARMSALAWLALVAIAARRRFYAPHGPI